MDAAQQVLKFATIPAEALDSEGSWDPALYACSHFRFMWMASRGAELSISATIYEGNRGLSPASDGEFAPFYRASSISPFELDATLEQWSTAADRSDRFSLQPGDVILKRVAPVVAAVVPAGLPSLPVDASFFVIRGLAEPDAWWATFCLNYPACADYLLSKSGRGVLSRVSLSVLRGWTPPKMPADFPRRARGLSELLQKRTFLAGRIAALEVAVEMAVAEQMATTAYEDTEQRFAQPSWSGFFPAVLAEDSWHPTHVASTSRATALRRDRDWRPLSSFLLPAPPSRNRLSRVDTPVAVLRLSDVDQTPLVPESLVPSVPAQANRVFSEPLHAEDVVLSTLGSSPRVAFMPSNPQAPVYAVDHWERLRFRAHAAAFALILQTGAVTRQLRGFASGSVQQFIRPEDIQRLFLPVLPEETLAQWDRSFRSLAKSWQQTEADWQSALRDGWQIFARAFNLLPSEAFPHHP